MNRSRGGLVYDGTKRYGWGGYGAWGRDMQRDRDDCIRWLARGGMGQHEIARRFGLSYERVRQIVSGGAA